MAARTAGGALVVLLVACAATQGRAPPMARASSNNVSMTNMTGHSAVSDTARCPGPSRAPAPQAYVWNVIYEPPSTGALDLSGLPATATQQVACGYTGADSAAGMHDNWVGHQVFGFHPMVYDAAGRVQTAGGVPQNLSLAAHIAQLQVAVELTLPPDFDGVLGLDYEGWQPVWDEFLYGGIQAVSEAIVREQHPGWDNQTVLVEAMRQFEAAAREYYQATVRTLKAARPKMRVGFYDTPFRGWHSYAEKRYAANQLLHNNNLTWLWQEVDVLMPVLYLKEINGTTHGAAEATRALLAEAERVALLSGKHLPVVPFSWMRTGSEHGEASFLSPADLAVDMVVPFEFPSVESVMVWGDNAVGDVSIGELQAYYNSTFVPMAKAAVEQQCACAAAMCGGQGRCVLNNTRCLCYDGFGGPNCTRSAEGHGGGTAGIAGCSKTLERYCFVPEAARGHLIRTVAPWPTYQSGCCHLCNTTAGCLSWQYNVTLPGKSCQLYNASNLPATETYHCVVSADAKPQPAPGPPAPGPPAPGPPAPAPGPPPPPPPFEPWPLPKPINPAPPDKPTGAVTCGDGLAFCPPANTCGQLTTGRWACCPLPNATICAHATCCPAGYACDHANRVCYQPA